MENATKALLIAAGVLMGVMILSLGLALFTDLQNYVQDSHEQIKFNELNKFNTQFTKYINYINSVKQFNLTIQDVVTAANIAYANNSSYNITPSEWIESPDSLYVSVYLDGTRIDQNIKDNMADLLDTNLGQVDSSNNVTPVYYMCTNNDLEYSETTGRVYIIRFRKI